MNTNLRGRDFIGLRGYSREDLETILSLAFDLKLKCASGQPHPLLVGKTLGMLFYVPSTRTRISFETAMTQLGGHAQYYAPEHLWLGSNEESLKDTASVMSRFVDGLVARVIWKPGVSELKYGEGHELLENMALYATVPVISAADDVEHPCQAMTDIMTINEIFGHKYKGKKVTMVWVDAVRGIAPGAAHSMIAGAGILGMNLTVAYPKGYDLDPVYLEESQELAKLAGGNIEVVHDINEAVKDASVIYAKGWKALGLTHEEDMKARESLQDWRIAKKHFDLAAPDSVFMHSMPLLREYDAKAEVADGPMSVIYNQAENRLHTQKAILSLLMS